MFNTCCYLVVISFLSLRMIRKLLLHLRLYSLLNFISGVIDRLLQPSYALLCFFFSFKHKRLNFLFASWFLLHEFPFFSTSFISSSLLSSLCSSFFLLCFLFPISSWGYFVSSTSYWSNCVSGGDSLLLKLPTSVYKCPLYVFEIFLITLIRFMHFSFCPSFLHLCSIGLQFSLYYWSPWYNSL